MKELTVEQKAKAYDNLIERLKDFQFEYRFSAFSDTIDKYFPELKENKESEGEKIRKVLIGWINLEPSTSFNDTFDGFSKEQILAWLEKQGEQKSIDDLTPQEAMDIAVAKCFEQGEQKPALDTKLKIEEGKWYVCISQFCNCIKGRVYKATSNNRIMDDFGTEYDMHSDAYKYFRLWTIQDAKDGDVLVVDNINFIYKRTLASHIISYCKLINDVFEPNEDARTCCEGNTYVRPATKEQRDLLFQKMREAGYEWDADKKELKKIVVPIFHIGDRVRYKEHSCDGVITEITDTDYICGDAKLPISTQDKLELVEQKPAEWSEEDENEMNHILSVLEDKQKEQEEKGYNNLIGTVKWLKYIKGRVQPHQEWGDEDEHGFENCLYAIKETFKGVDNPHRVGTIDWLESLKNRVQPKPRQSWKQENTDDLTDFENAMMHIGGSFFGQYAGLDPNDTNVIKEQANFLLELVSNKEWSEEDTATISRVISIVKWTAYSDHSHPMLNDEGATELVERLKSLKDRFTWRPSEEQIKALEQLEEIHVLKCEKTKENAHLYVIIKSLKEQLKQL